MISFLWLIRYWSYLTWTNFIIIFEIDDTFVFTLTVISAVENALSKHFTVLPHTWLKIGFILIIQFTLGYEIIYAKKPLIKHRKSRWDYDNQNNHWDNPTGMDKLKNELNSRKCYVYFVPLEQAVISRAQSSKQMVSRQFSVHSR